MNREDFQSALTEIFRYKMDNSIVPGMLEYVKNADGMYYPKEFFPEGIVTPETIDAGIARFSAHSDWIRGFMERVNLNEDLTDWQKNFLNNITTTMREHLKCFQNAIFLEAEKCGIELSDADRQKYLNEVNRLQNDYYGPEISEIPEEKALVGEQLEEIFQKNKEKISHEERVIFEKFLQKSGFNQENPKKEKSSEVTLRKEKSEDLKQIFLGESAIVEILEMVLDLYEMRDWAVEVNENRKMFAVHYDAKKIILPKNKLSSTSLFRLLELMDHEIGVHAIRGVNTLATLQIAGMSYLPHEEGMAATAEDMLVHDMATIEPKITHHHLISFIAENLDSTETEQMLKIYFQLTDAPGYDKMAHDWTMRIKRFMSHKMPGANRKDVSYSRGNRDIVEKLTSLSDDERKKFFQDYYFSKLSFNDHKFLPELRKLFPESEQNSLYPQWVGKILFRKLIGEKIFFQDFTKKDGRFVHNVNSETQRKIVKILQKIQTIPKNISQ